MSHHTIRVIDQKQNSPAPITDRFGDYMSQDVLDKFWPQLATGTMGESAGDLLRGRYDAGEQDSQGNSLYAECAPGDPRNFQYEEAGFVAFWNGMIGIHSEIEMAVEFNDLDLPKSFAPEELTPDEFKALAEYCTESMLVLAEKYPHTQFYIAHSSNVTFEGRVTLNGFTPLLNGRLPSGTVLGPQSLALMISPYHGKSQDSGELNITFCPAIKRIGDGLSDLAMDAERYIRELSVAA